MSRNICGNCAYFKAGKGQRFYNCTYATHGGTAYRMQVRADTVSCDAFKPLGSQEATAPSKQTPSKQIPSKRPSLKQEQAQVLPTGLCPWGRLIVVVVIILILCLLAWGAYAFATKSTKPSPVPVTTPTTTVSGSPAPKPTPVPAYLIIGNYTVGQWVQIPGELGSIVSASKTNSIPGEIGSLRAPAGLVYIKISVSASNTRVDSKIPISEKDFLLGDDTGARWQSSVSTLAKESNTIAPGSSVSGNIWFLVPDKPYSGLKVYWELMQNPMKWTVWNLRL